MLRYEVQTKEPENDKWDYVWRSLKDFSFETAKGYYYQTCRERRACEIRLVSTTKEGIPFEVIMYRKARPDVDWSNN